MHTKLCTNMSNRHNIKCMFLRRLKGKWKQLLITVLFLIVLYVAGVLQRILEKDFNTRFRYPYEGNIEKYVFELRNNQTPSMKPINVYNYSYFTNCRHKCNSNNQLRLVFLIKSAPDHFDRRLIIRKTWGYENRFSDVPIRTVFLLGTTGDAVLQNHIKTEYDHFKDIVQANFVDSYFNNTIKTMMGFKWAVTVCPYAKFYMFVDDDMYVSTKNVLRYIRNPTNYPVYLKDQNVLMNNVLLRSRRQLNLELPDGIRLYTGYVKRASPLRDLFSKWYITLDEYPYNYFPLYATAGAYIVSIEALMDMYYASFYTQSFRFDDVYLGLIALKAGIEPYHTDYIYLFKKEYDPKQYTCVISSHGYDNPEELLKVWTEQKELGNA